MRCNNAERSISILQVPFISPPSPNTLKRLSDILGRQDPNSNNYNHFPKRRCVSVAMKVTSIIKPIKASIAEAKAVGSAGENVPGKKPLP